MASGGIRRRASYGEYMTRDKHSNERIAAFVGLAVALAATIGAVLWIASVA
jgi:hypothetical protein